MHVCRSNCVHTGVGIVIFPHTFESPEHPLPDQQPAPRQYEYPFRLFEAPHPHTHTHVDTQTSLLNPRRFQQIFESKGLGQKDSGVGANTTVIPHGYLNMS